MSKKQLCIGLYTPFIEVMPTPITKTSAPTTSDTNYDNGQIWVYKNGDSRSVYIYGGQAANGDAVWSLASPGASEVDTLTGDSGGAISPAAGNITIAGSPGDNELTYFRIGRDVSEDDMAGDCRLHGIKLHFTTDLANDA